MAPGAPTPTPPETEIEVRWVARCAVCFAAVASLSAAARPWAGLTGQVRACGCGARVDLRFPEVWTPDLGDHSLHPRGAYVFNRNALGDGNDF